MVVFAHRGVERRQQAGRHAADTWRAYGASGRDRRRRHPVRPELSPPHAVAVLRHSHAGLAVRRAVSSSCDMFGASGGVAGSNMAYSMHLAGAAFAFVYYQRGWNLTRLTPGRIAWPSFRRKPRLRVHTPTDEPQAPI